MIISKQRLKEYEKRVAELEAENAQLNNLLNWHTEHLCFCGLPMSLNPHPFAGDPRKIAEVGATYVCIPCQKSINKKWCDRAVKAEAENAQLKAEKEKLRGNALLLYRLGIGVGNDTADCKAEAKKILAEIGKELNDE